VGPLAAGVAFLQSHSKPTAGSTPLEERRISETGVLPRYGNVVVVATCPAGQQMRGGGYTLPSALSKVSYSRADGTNAWRVEFKSLGGSGKAQVYATCAGAK